MNIIVTQTPQGLLTNKQKVAFDFNVKLELIWFQSFILIILLYVFHIFMYRCRDVTFKKKVTKDAIIAK